VSSRATARIQKEFGYHTKFTGSGAAELPHQQRIGDALDDHEPVSKQRR
jgi:hypothetical protein